MSDAWRPTEGRYVHPTNIAEGMIVAVDAPGWRQKPWRVHEIRTLDEDDGRVHVVFRPPGDIYDLAEHNRSAAIRKHASIYRLPDHYSLCHVCGELPPCTHVWTERLSTADAERNARFEVEGICPSCQKPVTRRQDVHRFDENLYVPLGPPVTFHARQTCAGGAVAYDSALAKKNGTPPRLSCEGRIVHHLDGDRACSNITCPGPRLRHRAMSMCYVLAEKCNRPECWALEDSRAIARGEGH